MIFKEVMRGSDARQVAQDEKAEVRAAGHPGRGDLGRAESFDVREVAGDLTEQVVLHPCVLTVQVAKPCATADLKVKDTELMAHGPQVEAERFDQLCLSSLSDLRGISHEKRDVKAKM